MPADSVDSRLPHPVIDIVGFLLVSLLCMSCSNNSVFATLGMDYSRVCERIVKNGEPGIAWLDNMRRFSRMGDPEDNKDRDAMGGNPCLEQTLESYELCCLVETFPHSHGCLEDYLVTLKYALLYAKTVTLGPTHWPLTNSAMMKNRCAPFVNLDS